MNVICHIQKFIMLFIYYCYYLLVLLFNNLTFIINQPIVICEINK